MHIKWCNDLFLEQKEEEKGAVCTFLGNRLETEEVVLYREQSNLPVLAHSVTVA